MNIYCILLLVTFIVFSTLLVGVLRDTRTKIRQRFALYVIVAMAWSLSVLIFYLSIFYLNIFGFTRALASIAALIGVCTIIAYYDFVCNFAYKTSNVAVKLGYAAVALVLAPLAALGYIPERVSITNGAIDIIYGPFLYLITAIGAVFFLLSVVALVRGYRASADPLSRNRIAYLSGGLALYFAFSIRSSIPPGLHYPLEHIGHLANSLVIGYAIMKYKLLDIKFLIRKGLVYSLISIFVTASFLLILYSVHYLLQGWNTSANLAAIFAMALLMAWLFNPLRMAVQKTVDRMFYGESYDYRQMVVHFSQRMSSVLDLSQLAEAMLCPITKAVGASQASLLLSSDGAFLSQYAERLVEGDSIASIKLIKDSPIIDWLSRESKPLTREIIDLTPEFKGAEEVEIRSFDAMGIELLCPIKSKGNLIGILALSKKLSGGSYSGDDMDLLVTVANEAGVVMENAQLYGRAKERAHTDELTGLFNHRYFHERLDEEISRCSRFGDILSLLFLDIDLFKAYNDIYGHLAGDDMLKQIGQYIKSSIRSIDMAFRYGGDEFTVILPQSSLEDASRVAERIRKKIEIEMDSKGSPLTCSIGVASWPTDGVMREEIIQAADVSLYHAKEMGRNRICLASEITSADVLSKDANTEREPGILSTIYALAATVDAKDHYTYGHSKKVSKYATGIAEALGYSQERIATIRAAALLHDIGKIGVADRLLMKSGPLSDEDWEPIHAHPKLGVAILKHVESLSGCLAAIQYHHEHYDGTGYPAGLKGENIPLDARIMAVADSYDAMISLRPYRQGKFTQEQALAELKRCAGTQFDPKIIEAFVALSERQLAADRANLKEAKARQSMLQNPNEA
jgi:diguanylate cyclase (GGDEF)-like protein/putative nucleotidyltransferase with HDIG domain